MKLLYWDQRKKKEREYRNTNTGHGPKCLWREGSKEGGKGQSSRLDLIANAAKHKRGAYYIIGTRGRE